MWWSKDDQAQPVAAVDEAAVLKVARMKAQQPAALPDDTSDIVGLRQLGDALSRMGLRLKVDIEAPEVEVVPRAELPGEWQEAPLPVRDRLPEHLKPSMTAWVASDEQPTGPTASVALLCVERLTEVARIASQPHDLLQQTWAASQNNRDRDLIHAVLPCGDGAGYTAALLTHLTAGAPADYRIRNLTWEYAVACVRADAGICRDATAAIQRAVEAREGEELERMSSALQRDVLPNLVAGQTEAGMSRLGQLLYDTTDTLGDRLLMAMLETAAGQLDEVAAFMEELPSA